MYSYRVEGEMHADPETVFYFVDPTPQSPRSTWDQAIKELQTVATISEVHAAVVTAHSEHQQTNQSNQSHLVRGDVVSFLFARGQQLVIACFG